MFTKTHPLQSYHIDCIVGQKIKEALLSCSGHICPSNRIDCRKRQNRGIVQIYHTYSSAESSIINVRFRLFVCFSLWYLVSGPRVHTAHVFSIRVCVMDMAAGRVEAMQVEEGAKSGIENRCISEENKGMVG